jgi:hypothetical protein
MYSALCLPHGFITGLNRILLPRARERFKELMEVGICDSRDQDVWRGVKEDIAKAILDKVPDECSEKKKRMPSFRR